VDKTTHNWWFLFDEVLTTNKFKEVREFYKVKGLNNLLL